MYKKTVQKIMVLPAIPLSRAEMPGIAHANPLPITPMPGHSRASPLRMAEMPGNSRASPQGACKKLSDKFLHGLSG